MNKHGRIIIPFGVIPEKHELLTANFLVERGKEVEFLAPSRAKGVCSPDVLIDGQRWEIKSPCGGSPRTIENNFRRAQKQSENIIFDLRRIRLNEKTAVSKIKSGFLLHRGNKTRHIMIITKDHNILDLV